MKELPKNRANFTQLTPLSFLYRTVEIFPKRLAWVYGKRKATYIDFYIRCKNFKGIVAKDLVLYYLFMKVQYIVHIN